MNELAEGSARHRQFRPFVVFLVTGMALLIAGGLILRGIDLNRIEQSQVEANTKATRALERQADELEKTTAVLCNRGYVLIDLIDGALLLVGQRLEADVAAGNKAAAAADRQFLQEFALHRDVLTGELTGNGPCAP